MFALKLSAPLGSRVPGTVGFSECRVALLGCSFRILPERHQTFGFPARTDASSRGPLIGHPTKRLRLRDNGEREVRHDPRSQNAHRRRRRYGGTCRNDLTGLVGPQGARRACYLRIVSPHPVKNPSAASFRPRPARQSNWKFGVTRYVRPAS